MGKITLTLVLLITLTAVAHSQTETNNTGLLFAPLPEILVSNDGTAIQSAGQWEDVRRAEILELFRDHVYGHVPESDLSITHRVKYLDMNVLYGAAIQKEVEVQVSNGEKSMNFPDISSRGGSRTGTAFPGTELLWEPDHSSLSQYKCHKQLGRK